MLKIGITSGIGGGKTTVAKIFETLGVPIYYADVEAKKILNTNILVKEKITKLFGEMAYVNQEYNSKYIAQIVFNDNSKLDTLNSIIHPVIINDAKEWMQKQHVPYILKEAALIFESGSQASLDYVIGIDCPKHLRISRIMQRDSISEDEVLARMNKQLDEKIKLKLCNFIIYNNEQQLLIPQVIELHKKISKIWYNTEK